MTLPKLIKEVEKLTFPTKPTVLSKLKSVAAILAQIPEAKSLLEAPAPEPAKPAAAKPTQSDKAKTTKGGAMPVGG